MIDLCIFFLQFIYGVSVATPFLNVTKDQAKGFSLSTEESLVKRSHSHSKAFPLRLRK